ncbi:MAG: PDZ domain-containing protein [Firmicutes bacterium]|nr:PDZ domain-containing protein [Bacillota bacterium]
MKKNNITKNIVITIIVFFLGMGAMYGLVRYYPILISTEVTKIDKNVTITDTGIAEAVDKLYDAVVVVNTYQNGQEYSSGTGFVYKTDKEKAYILTNNHVINSGDDIYVTFTNGSVVKTEIIGSDVYSDIAVLAVDKEHIIKVAELGKSDKSRLGDTVFAIGAPLDSAYSWSVTRGIVSGKDRLVEVELTDGNTKTPMVVNTLQTDAAINSGNSGGPLANGNGEVVGITSIKLASSSIEGMGFAIPIENALDIADQLLKGNKVERPYLGIYMLDVTEAYYSREYYSLIKDADLTAGVIVTDIEDKSSASLAGIKEKDIITKIDGHEIANVAYLRYYLYKHKVGEEMQVTIIRDNKEKDIKVKLTAN